MIIQTDARRLAAPPQRNAVKAAKNDVRRMGLEYESSTGATRTSIARAKNSAGN